jgi:prepilin-type N-terminal cleavage/methylation domain-containing protein
MSRANRQRRGEQGFSMIELLVAATITLIGLTGLLGLHTATVQGTRASSQFSEASAFGVAAMEDLRSLSIPQLEARYGAMPVNDSILDTVAGRAGQTYTRTISLNPTPVSADLIQMRVVVSWTELGAVPGADNGQYDHRVLVELLRSRQEVL